MGPRKRQDEAATTTASDEPLSSLSEPLLPVASEAAQQQQEGASDQEDIASTAPPVSRNVRLTLAYTGLAFAGRGIWVSNVLATYVYMLRQNYEAVGYITAIMGLSQLLCSFPAAFFADAYRRDSLLKLASVVGAVAILLTLYALYVERFLPLVLALAVWGCSFGIANTSLSALFADSIPLGERSYYFTQRGMLLTSGITTGPIIALFAFFYLGDNWTVRDCAVVMAIGQLICFPAIVLLCFFNDDYAVDQGEGEGTTVAESQSAPEAGASETGEGDACRSDDGESDTAENTTLATQEEGNNNSDVEAGDQPEEDEALASSKCCWGRCAGREIAVLIAVADLMGGLAAGMSIRYFPIFFVDYLHLGPVKVQVLYVVAPLLGTLAMRLGQRLSVHYGRCQVSVAFRWIGVSLMYAVIASYHYRLPNWVICTLYVLRTTIINSTGALTKSVLMDNVPKKERAKWAALESLNMFGWAGSAALGGLLVGAIGMLPLFATTATLQLCATVPLVMLFSKDTAEVPMSSVSASTDSGSGNEEEEEEEETT